MRIAMLVNPTTDHNLQLAAQVGVSDIVCTYPGLDAKPLMELKRRVESFGMQLSHCERKVPHLKFVHNLPGRDQQIDEFKLLLQVMADAGMEVLCYNWMPDEDWQRTCCDVPERGGARVTEFNIRDVATNVTDASPTSQSPTSSAQLWENLRYFLESVLPVAEKTGVRLALHPDDPPMPILRGQPRIIINHDALQRVVELVKSPMNGICYCQGSLAPAGEDPVAGIKQLAPYIFFAHFRNTVGKGEHFRESFHDNGDIDMPSAIRAYFDVGYRGAIRPDHAPSMAGETNEHPGYEMLGRIYAAGYMRGLIQAVAGYPRKRADSTDQKE